jgi:hypothetical protein
LPFASANIERAPDACTALAKLGLDISMDGDFVILPTAAASLRVRSR